MKIGVLSGKGGTGKTFISVNLARVIPSSIYLDCDVEEPNGYLFFNPIIEKTRDIKIKVPSINNEKCTNCRQCVNFCRFNALVSIKNNIKVFDKLCHSCGGCKIICPNDAIDEVDYKVGQIEIGKWEEIKIITGKMNIGEVNGIPLINSVIDEGEFLNKDIKSDIIVDCPPGSACSVMESVERVDYCILVVEPTAFGLHNFKMVYELCNILNKPMGIIINKVESLYEPLMSFCRDNKVNILAEIPFSKIIANVLTNGQILVDVDKKYEELFRQIRKQIGEENEKNIDTIW